MVESEFKDYRALASSWQGQPTNFGSLSHMMRRFEISTGLELPTLEVWRPGRGIFRVSAQQEWLQSGAFLRAARCFQESEKSCRRPPGRMDAS